MIFAEMILLSMKDIDEVFINRVFYNCYYWQHEGVVFIEDLKGVRNKIPQNNVLWINMEFKPENLEPFKL